MSLSGSAAFLLSYPTAPCPAEKADMRKHDANFGTSLAAQLVTTYMSC